MEEAIKKDSALVTESKDSEVDLYKRMAEVVKDLDTQIVLSPRFGQDIRAGFEDEASMPFSIGEVMDQLSSVRALLDSRDYAISHSFWLDRVLECTGRIVSPDMRTAGKVVITKECINCLPVPERSFECPFDIVLDFKREGPTIRNVHFVLNRKLFKDVS